MAEATAIDDRLASGDPVGPLAGIPIGVKDLEDAAGFTTAYGSALHVDDPRGRGRLAARGPAAGGRVRGAGQDHHARVRVPGRHRPARRSARPATRGTPTGRRAARRAARPRPSPRAWCRWPRAATAAGRSASRPRCAGCRASRRRRAGCPNGGANAAGLGAVHREGADGPPHRRRALRARRVRGARPDRRVLAAAAPCALGRFARRRVGAVAGDLGAGARASRSTPRSPRCATPRSASWPPRAPRSSRSSASSPTSRWPTGSRCGPSTATAARATSAGTPDWERIDPGLRAQMDHAEHDVDAVDLRQGDRLGPLPQPRPGRPVRPGAAAAVPGHRRPHRRRSAARASSTARSRSSRWPSPAPTT